VNIPRIWDVFIFQTPSLKEIGHFPGKHPIAHTWMLTATDPTGKLGSGLWEIESPGRISDNFLYL
jgi:hypothetical protein